MNKGELCDWLVKIGKKYRNDKTSLIRNNHMHDYEGQPPSQELVDAIVVGLINTMAMEQGIDLALYASDLRK